VFGMGVRIGFCSRATRKGYRSSGCSPSVALGSTRSTAVEPSPRQLVTSTPTGQAV